MIDILEQGQQWLSDKLTTHASRPVVYERDSQGVEVTATIGRTLFEHDDGQGAVIQTQVRDYLIDANQLVLSEQPCSATTGRPHSGGR